MGSITHVGPSQVAAYATAAALTMKLAGPLFQTAMTGKAVDDPEDKTYTAWFTMRQVADWCMDNCSLALPVEMLASYKEALKIAHRNAHLHSADPPALMTCPCETATRCTSILQLLAGVPSNHKAKARR